MIERSIIDLLAQGLRKWRTAVVFALIFAVLLGSFQAYKINKSNNARLALLSSAEEEYAEKLEDCTARIAELEEDIALARENLDEEEKYASESAILSLDPNNIYKTSIVFAISDIPEDVLEANGYGLNTNLVDYMYKRIAAQYIALWNSIDLGEVLGIEDKYARELVSFESVDGAMMQLKVIAESEEASSAMAELAYKAAGEFTAAVSKTAFPHALSKIAASTVAYSDSSVKEKINKENDDIDKQRTALEALEAKLDELNEELDNITAPSVSTASVIKGSVKYAVVGAVLGAFGGAVLEMLLAMGTGIIINSTEIEDGTGFVFLGSAGKKHMGLTALADKLAGERVWKKREDGAAVIAARMGAAEDGKKAILLATTLEKPDSESIKLITEKLSAEGYSVSYCIDAQHSASFVNELRKADALVIAEEIGKSKAGAIGDIVAFADCEGIDILGFATI